MSKIEVQISADASRFKNGLKGAEQAAVKFGTNLKSQMLSAGAAFLSIGYIAGKAVEVVNKFGDIGDLAERFKVTAEELQRVNFVAEQTGSSAETMAKALGKVKLAMAEAVEKGGDAARIFDAAGLSIDRLRAGSVSPIDALTRLSGVINATESETGKLTIATAIFGEKMANEMLPILEMGETRMRGLAAAAPVMSNKTVAAAKAMSDEWKAYRNSVDQAWGASVMFFADMAPKAAAFTADMMTAGLFDFSDELKKQRAERLRGIELDEKAAQIADRNAKRKAEALAEERAANDAYGVELNAVSKAREDAIAAEAKAEEELQKLREQIGTAAADVMEKRLTKQELYNKLLADEAALREKMNGPQTKESLTAALDYVKTRGRREELQRQMESEQKQTPMDKPSLGKFSNQADQLQAVGLFAGGSAISYSRSMDENTRKTAENTARIARAVEGKTTTSPTVYAP